MYKIIYNKKKCIGSGECEALAPEMWKVNNKGRAELAGSTETSENIFELELTDGQVEAQKLVCGSCPVGCIKVEKV